MHKRQIQCTSLWSLLFFPAAAAVALEHRPLLFALAEIFKSGGRVGYKKALCSFSFTHRRTIPSFSYGYTGLAIACCCLRRDNATGQILWREKDIPSGLSIVQFQLFIVWRCFLELNQLFLLVIQQQQQRLLFSATHWISPKAEATALLIGSSVRGVIDCEFNFNK